MSKTWRVLRALLVTVLVVLAAAPFLVRLLVPLLEEGRGLEYCDLQPGGYLESVGPAAAEEDVELGRSIASIPLRIQHGDLVMASGGEMPILGPGGAVVGEMVVEIDGNDGGPGLRGSVKVSKSLISDGQDGSSPSEPHLVFEGKLEASVDLSRNRGPVVVTYTGTLVESGRPLSWRVQYQETASVGSY